MDGTIGSHPLVPFLKKFIELDPLSNGSIIVQSTSPLSSHCLATAVCVTLFRKRILHNILHGLVHEPVKPNQIIKMIPSIKNRIYSGSN